VRSHVTQRYADHFTRNAPYAMGTTIRRWAGHAFRRNTLIAYEEKISGDTPTPVVETPSFPPESGSSARRRGMIRISPVSRHKSGSRRYHPGIGRRSQLRWVARVAQGKVSRRGVRAIYYFPNVTTVKDPETAAVRDRPRRNGRIPANSEPTVRNEIRPSGRSRRTGTKRLQAETRDRSKVANVPGCQDLTGLARRGGDEGVGHL